MVSPLLGSEAHVKLGYNYLLINRYDYSIVLVKPNVGKLKMNCESECISCIEKLDVLYRGFSLNYESSIKHI